MKSALLPYVAWLGALVLCFAALAATGTIKVMLVYALIVVCFVAVLTT